MASITHSKILLRTLLITAFFVFAPVLVAHGQTWSAQTSGTSDNLRSVFFVNANTGWAVGGSSIFTTANGGSTWSAQTSGTTNPLLGVYFVNATNGWAVGASDDIRVTIDGGATWSAQTSGLPGNSNLRSVFFIDANTGWAVGDAGVIIATTNGGSTWSAQTSGTANTLRSVSFVNSTTGWAVGDSGVILTTTNGGSTWSAQTSGTSDDLQGVFFIGANTGWAVGGISRDGTQSIVATTNGGSTWSAQTSGTTDFLTGVSFVDANTGWIVSDTPTILTTTNGGTTWSAQNSGTVNSLYAVNFVNSTTGWAVGDSGTILKFTGASSGSSSGLSHPPLQFEEQQRALLLRLAPAAPGNIRVSSAACAPEHCPAELRFSYAPLALHRSRMTRFVFYDDQGLAVTSFTALPSSVEEYRMTVPMNGANGAISGRLCAGVGAGESCAPVQGFADIALDSDAIAWSDLLLDAARGEYRLSFQTVKLPANYTVGKTGAMITIYEDTDAKRVVAERSVALRPYTQLFMPAIPRGAYLVRVAPINAAGKPGVSVEQHITIPLSHAPNKSVSSPAGTNEVIKDALSRLSDILRMLLQLLRR